MSVNKKAKCGFGGATQPSNARGNPTDGLPLLAIVGQFACQIGKRLGTGHTTSWVSRLVVFFLGLGGDDEAVAARSGFEGRGLTSGAG
jgi:hypothetical protein